MTSGHISVVHLFPGQGSQFPGMGKQLYEKYSEVRQIYASAKKIAGFDVAEISFEADKKTLAQTRYTQPCIFTHSYAVLIALGSKAEFSAVAGHSLGEYSALVAGGVLSFEDGLRAVTVRGQVMSQAEAGGMLAPLGANLDTVQEVVDELKEKGIIEVANYNAPGQIIISGEKDILKFAAEMLKERGAKKIIPLPVSGAFHSPLMNDAQKEMKKLLDKIEFGKPKVMFYSNVTGDKIESPEEIRKNLVLQITNPVRWMNIIENMTGNGVDKFVEIGPGKVLQGLIARIDNEVITTDWQSILEL